MARRANPEELKTISPDDLAIGLRIRTRRKALGLPQTVLASLLHVSYQQIQKYELGRNRVPCTSLGKIADLFECTVDDLMRGDLHDFERADPCDRSTMMSAAALVHAFSRIDGPEDRQLVLSLAQSLSRKARL